MGRVRKTGLPDGTTTTRGYHDAGLLLSEAYSGGPLSGLSVTNAYDALLRRRAVGVGGTTLAPTLYGYDAASRHATVSNGVNGVAYSYLANAPLVSHVVHTSNSTVRLTTTNRYDLLNRLTGKSSTASAPSAGTVSFDYAYNSANQRVAVTNADSSKWVYEYDTLGQVVSGKKQWSDGTPVAGQHFEYGFDDIGNRTTAKAGGDTTGANLRVSTFAANSLNQYTSRTVPGYVPLYGTATNTATVTVWGSTNATPTNPSAPGATARKGDYFWKEFAVDNASAPAWASFTNIGALKNAGTNGLDIVATNTGSVLLAPATETFLHDADGNQTRDGLWTNVWDAENRLLAMESRAEVPAAARRKVTFTYDAQWRRTSKQSYVWNTNTLNYQLTNTLNFCYDGWNLIAERDATNGLVRSYAWGTDLSGTPQGAGGVGGLIAMTVHQGANAGTYHYSYDGNGNVAGLVSAVTGDWVARYEYDPFGRTLRATGPLARENPFRFSTKYQDDETGLYYYGYRYYDPETGRWFGRDPIGERGGVNLYTIGMNSPMNGIDALGLNWMNSRPFDFLDCMGRCIEANDPLNWIASKVLLSLEGMMLPKTLVANLAEAAGDQRLANGIRASLNNPSNSRVTTLPGTVAAALRAPGKASAIMHALGNAVSPFWLSYGLYLAQVEAACAGHCACSRHYDSSIGIWLPLDVNKLLDKAIEGIRSLGSPAPVTSPGFTGQQP